MGAVLPPRAYSEPLPPYFASGPEPSAPDARPALIVAVAPSDVKRFPSSPYALTAARSTAEAVRLIERWRPRCVAVDWDAPEFDAAAICDAARQSTPVAILAVMQQPERAPAALRAGCHAVLLKPFALNLVAARLGRLCREMPPAAPASRPGAIPEWAGTNRTWPDVSCPTCDERGAIGFEHSSHRRSWYACLKCDHVWLGVRRE